jgi:hypothetical protein
MLAELSSGGSGAESQNRTGDTAIFSRVLYQLSYLGTVADRADRPAAAGEYHAPSARRRLRVECLRGPPASGPAPGNCQNSTYRGLMVAQVPRRGIRLACDTQPVRESPLAGGPPGPFGPASIHKPDFSPVLARMRRTARRKRPLSASGLRLWTDSTGSVGMVGRRRFGPRFEAQATVIRAQRGCEAPPAGRFRTPRRP